MRSRRRWAAGRSALADVGWNSLYWNNHDQPRAVSRFGSDAPEHRVAAAKLLGTVLHLHRGTPYVYQGEELGHDERAVRRRDRLPGHRVDQLPRRRGGQRAGPGGGARRAARDEPGQRPHPGAVGRRAHAGFTTGTPWFPVNPNYREINAAAQWADPDSVLHHYRALIALRHAEPAVVHGDFTMLLPDDPLVYAFTRRLGDVQLLVLANFSRRPGHRGVAGRGGWDEAELVLGNLPDPPRPRARRRCGRGRPGCSGGRPGPETWPGSAPDRHGAGQLGPQRRVAPRQVGGHQDRVHLGRQLTTDPFRGERDVVVSLAIREGRVHGGGLGVDGRSAGCGTGDRRHPTGIAVLVATLRLCVTVQPTRATVSRARILADIMALSG